MFGCESKIGITSSSLPTEVIATLQSEDDLVTAVTGSTSDNPVTHTTEDLTSQNSIPSTSSAVLDVPAHENTTTPQDNTTVQNHVPPINSAVPIVSSQVLADRTSRIQKRRATPYSGQVAQAERVVKRTRVDLNAGVAGDNVAVPIPLVDRGRGDPRNILGVIVNRNLDTDTIAVKAGILNGCYSRNQFDLCLQRLLTLDDVDQGNRVSLRTAVICTICWWRTRVPQKQL